MSAVSAISKQQEIQNPNKCQKITNIGFRLRTRIHVRICISWTADLIQGQSRQGNSKETANWLEVIRLSQLHYEGRLQFKGEKESIRVVQWSQWVSVSN